MRIYSKTTKYSGYDGTGVGIAILDSGINPDHPEFAGRILPGYDFINDDAAAYIAGEAIEIIATAATEHSVFCLSGKHDLIVIVPAVKHQAINVASENQ